MLVARDLTKEYRSGEHELTVLRDVNFNLPQGAFVAIVGPSGSGKTTLLGLLAGLDTPSRGTVLLDGADLTRDGRGRSARRLRGEKVGFVFQSFQLIPTLTALENVQVPLELRGDAARPTRARELLAPRRPRRPARTTFRRSSPAASSSASPSRARSPTRRASSSPTSRRAISTATPARASSSCSSRSTASRSTTIMLVTHDLALAARAQRIIRLSDGRVVSDTETERAA